MSSFWARNPFSIGVRKHRKPLGDTNKLLAEARLARCSSPLVELDSLTFAYIVIQRVISHIGFRPSDEMLTALIVMLEDVYAEQALLEVTDSVVTSLSGKDKRTALREYLRTQIRFIDTYEPSMEALTWYCESMCILMLEQVPQFAVQEEADSSFLNVSYLDLLRDPEDTIETVVVSVFHDRAEEHNLCTPIRKRIEANIMRVSKIDPYNQPKNSYKYKLPTQTKNLSPTTLVDEYLVGTPFRHIFKTKLPLPFKEEARFEHSHILGGTGHGKTQFIQRWISHDLQKATQERRSVIIIDSQGDLIRKVSQLDMFHPEHGALRDKLIIVDPTDVCFPAAINMFAMNEVRLASYGAVEREKVQNAAIALYEHFFGELLGAELTSKQGTVFKYLARLMLEIPDATILTLRDLMDDHTPFLPYMDKLTGSARMFFAREFFDRGFAQTKKQISKRLWAVLSTPAFERLFSSKVSKIDLYSAMNDGSVILINTAKDLLKQDGASLYGRFFLSMTGQAILERATIPEHKRTPTFIYIDECQDYFDDTVELLLTQGRKYKVALTLAHQYLDQMSSAGKASLLSNTSIKSCGGINAKDARIMAQEMGVDVDFLKSIKKTDTETEFAFWVKHDLDQAVRIQIPFGHLERLPKMSPDAYRKLYQRNRETFCWEYVPEYTADTIAIPGLEKTVEQSTVRIPTDIEPPCLPEPNTPEPDVSGRGGTEHLAIQNMIRSLAHEYGWRAEAEFKVKDGFVDVWLERPGLSIACEITVTTPVEYELHNIEKCLTAGADEVWVISEDNEKLDEIRRQVSSQSNIIFLAPDSLPNEIEARSDIETTEGASLRGFSVDLKRTYVSAEDREIRRRELASVLKSIR